MNVSDHIVAVLKSFDIEPKPIDRLMDSYFRRHHEIGAALRREISDAVFDIMRFKRRIDGLLTLAGHKRIDHRLRATTGHGANLLRDRQLTMRMSTNFPGGPAAFYSFPDFLYDRLVRSYGKDGAARLAASLNEPAGPTLRVNVLKITRDEAARKLAEDGVESTPTTRSPYGLILNRRVNLDLIGLYQKGFVELQDESSQMAAIFAAPKAGETVLDACAGAGGKTLALAMLMGNRGRIIASDLVSGRLKELEKRVKRAGISIVTTVPGIFNSIVTTVPGIFNSGRGKFDLVFIDAPCSGTGTIRRNPDLKWRLSDEVINERVKGQKEILARYAAWVRPGGRLVYATCSVLEEENEGVVDDFLRRGGFRVEGYLKMDPREGNWDGFFAAIITCIH